MSLKNNIPVNIAKAEIIDKKDIQKVRRVYCALYKSDMIIRNYYKPIIKIKIQNQEDDIQNS